MKILAKHDMELPLGKQGMNEATVIRFPIEHLTDEFGRGGSFQLLHQRSKDKAPYPCQITEDQFFVYWAVTEQDVQYAGIGKAELQYRREGVVFKSLTWRTRTEAGLGEATEAPELQRGWVDELLDAAAGIEGQSKAAKTAATKAEQSAGRTAKLEQSTREMVKGAENELDKAKPMVFEVRTRMTEPFVYEIIEPTFETLKEKHDAGYHNLWLHSGNYQMPLTHTGSGDREQFKATYTLASETAVRGYEWLFTPQGSPYTNTIMGPELKSNRITSLEEEPAATQYPSAGAVYEALKKKSDTDHTHSYNELEDKPTIPEAYDDTKLRRRITDAENDIQELQDKVEIRTENIAKDKWVRGYINKDGSFANTSKPYAKTTALNDMLNDGDAVSLKIEDVPGTQRLVFVSVFTDPEFTTLDSDTPHIPDFPDVTKDIYVQELSFTYRADRYYIVTIGRDTQTNDMLNSDYPSQMQVVITPKLATMEKDISDLQGTVSSHSEEITKQKQLMPSGSPVVGKLARVAEVLEDGTFRMEWVDAPSGGVSDVTVNGASVVADGVAAVPKATNDTVGAVKGKLVFGTGIDSTGGVMLREATSTCIDNRYTQDTFTTQYGAITPTNMDYAVRSSLTNEKCKVVYSAEQQQAACERLGAEPKHGKFELIERVTLSEAVQSITRLAQPNGTPYNFASVMVVTRTTAGAATANINVGLYFDGGATTASIINAIMTTGRNSYGGAFDHDGVKIILARTSSGGGVEVINAIQSGVLITSNPFTKLVIGSSVASTKIPAGSVIEIYAVRE